MIVKKITLGQMQVNCYLVYMDKINFIIDPGFESKKIISELTRAKIVPDFILNTHCHFDHISAVPELMLKYKIPFYIHPNEEPILKNPELNCSSFFSENELSLITYNLISNEKNNYFKNIGIEIIETPGHTPGSITIRVDNYLFTGDLLFKGSIGRTDLPGGSIKEIKNSLKKIKNIKDNLLIYPGHGNCSSLSQELIYNEFLSDYFLSDLY